MEIKLKEIDVECNKQNEGMQVLAFADQHLNVIVRNQQRMSDVVKKYKITIEEIRPEPEIVEDIIEALENPEDEEGK